MQLQRWGCFPGGDVPHHRKRRQGGQSAHDPDRHQTPAGHWNNAAANAVAAIIPMYMTDVLSERMVPRTSGLSSEAKALSAVWAKANASAHAECSAMVPSRFPVTDATAETPSAATMSRNRAVFLAGSTFLSLNAKEWNLAREREHGRE